jgi:hypothetical protein
VSVFACTVYVVTMRTVFADCVGLVSLHELGESTTTYIRMFVENLEFFKSFRKFRDSKFGFKDHKVIVCVDGAAMGHHIGNSGHAAVCGCCFCTRSKKYKHGPPPPPAARPPARPPARILYDIVCMPPRVALSPPPPPPPACSVPMAAEEHRGA